MKKLWNWTVVFLIVVGFYAIITPVAAETGCEIYYDNCQYECDQLKNEISDLDYKAKSVFDCHERICSNSFEDKFCGIVQYAPCMQKVMDSYFSCMRNCIAQYRQASDSKEKSDIRAFCPGECICNYYQDLYQTCDKSVCDEYCAELGYLNSEYLKTTKEICTSGSRKEYQYDCECYGTLTATTTMAGTTKPTTIQTISTIPTTILTTPATASQQRVQPSPSRALAQDESPVGEVRDEIPDDDTVDDWENPFILLIRWLESLFGISPYDGGSFQPQTAEQQQTSQQQDQGAAQQDGGAQGVPQGLQQHGLSGAQPYSSDPDPDRGDYGQPPNLDGTCDQGAFLEGLCRQCGRWGERACPLSSGYECEPGSENRGGRCMVIDPYSCGQVGTKPCDQEEDYDQPFCYEGVLDPSGDTYSCVVCGQFMDVCCENTDYPCDSPYVCRNGRCVKP